MANEINRITNANVYTNGNSLLGKVEEWQLPAIKGKTTDAKVLGLQMDLEFPAGFEKMTGKVKFNAVYPELIEYFGDPYQTQQVQVRANLETWDTGSRTGQKPAVAFLTLRFKDSLPSIGLKMNDNPEQESEYSCSYYRLEIDGVRMVEIDAFTNVFFIKDKDVLAQYRINLGL